MIRFPRWAGGEIQEEMALMHIISLRGLIDLTTRATAQSHSLPPQAEGHGHGI